MSDPITLVTGTLAALKTAFDMVKTLKDADKVFVEANYKAQLSEVFMSLVDARGGIAELKTALVERDQEICDLKEKLRVKGIKIWEPPCYWIQEEGGRTGPYCQVCLDRDEKLIRLQSEGEGAYVCRACDKRFYSPDRHRKLMA
jgi:hypothetical protein